MIPNSLPSLLLLSFVLLYLFTSILSFLSILILFSLPNLLSKLHNPNSDWATLNLISLENYLYLIYAYPKLLY
jgi:hypothetical protein